MFFSCYYYCCFNDLKDPKAPKVLNDLKDLKALKAPKDPKVLKVPKDLVDLSGRRVSDKSRLHHGLYVTEGKKIAY